VAELGRDRLVQGAVLMASALPDDDFETFVAATMLLSAFSRWSRSGQGLMAVALMIFAREAWRLAPLPRPHAQARRRLSRGVTAAAGGSRGSVDHSATCTVTGWPEALPRGPGNSRLAPRAVGASRERASAQAADRRAGQERERAGPAYTETCPHGRGCGQEGLSQAFLTFRCSE
jgi:hypothetical protein